MTGASETNEQAGEDQLPAGGKIMTLTEHLGELQGRLVKSFLAIIVIFFVATFYSTDIINYIKVPLAQVLPKGASVLHYTGPMDVFMVSMKISFLVAIIGACPVWIYHFWRFVEPALYENERKWILPFIFSSSFLFLAGVVFCYIVLFPMTLEFMIGLGSEVATSIITVGDYVSLLMFLVLASGLIFQTPVVLVMLALLDLIDVETLAKNRRTVLVICLVIAAILTPPDPLSQMGLTIPMYLMFEMSIHIIRLIKRKEEKAT